MSYYFSKTIDLNFDETVAKVEEALKQEGFGILTEINVNEVLKKKLDVDFKKYKILGACNPPLAYRALQTEENIGLMLPCNFVVKYAGENQSEVLAINPSASMMAVDNENLKDVAQEVNKKIECVIENL